MNPPFLALFLESRGIFCGPTWLKGFTSASCPHLRTFAPRHASGGHFCCSHRVSDCFMGSPHVVGEFFMAIPYPT
ncbi:hypothetical protein F5146DRAFT_1050812 [Armillaria mellea]|nr:hypothetical protein F5146DRAFT_1050812 [Armillaria mellea]